MNTVIVLPVLILTWIEIKTDINNKELSFREEKEQYYSNIVPSFVKNEINCLAKNIYFEARSENDEEQIAVANVTLNRLASEKYPDSICKVVYEPYQFSWTLDKNLTVKNKWAWAKANEIAKQVYDDTVKDNTGGATHYYAHNKINPPKWADKEKITIVMNSHTYFKGIN